MSNKKGVWDLQDIRDKQLQSLWGKQDGKLFSFGRNNYGELGQNTASPASSSSPIQVGSDATWEPSYYANPKGAGGRAIFHSIKSDGTMWTWGYNEEGVLGIPSYAHNAKISSPVQVGSDTNWNATFTTGNGSEMRAAIKNDNTLWVWGSNSYGSLGLNAPTSSDKSSPTQIPGTSWKQISAGDSRVGAIKNDNTLWVWGRNHVGQLGQNDRVAKSSPVQIPGTNWESINVGYNAVHGIKQDGTMWVWGSNTWGSLGLSHAPNTSYVSSPTQLPGTTWKMVDTGNMGHTIAIKTDGTMWAWGYNNYGVLGNNSNSDAGQPSYSSPIQVGTDTNWTHISCEQYDSSCALKTDGTLHSWGHNSYGELGQKDTVSRSSPTQITGTWSGVSGGTNGFILYQEP